MAGQAFFNNGVNISGGGNLVINSLLGDIVNEMDFQDEYVNYREAMAFNYTRPLSIDEKFSGIAGPLEADVIIENGLKPELEKTKLPDKGFAVLEIGDQVTTSFLMYKWLQTNQPLTGASVDVKKNWLEFRDNSRYLLESQMMKITMDMVRLWSLGLSPVSALFGPGSATPKGRPLFSQTHPIRNNTATFANVAPTNVAFNSANLQTAVDILKSGTRNENGYVVRQPKRFFKLYVGKDLAVTARQVLNTAGSQVGIYSGVLNNSNQINQFSFNGNMIEIVELPRLGQIDKNGVSIGGEAYRFLTNPDFLDMSKGFKYTELYSPELKNYVNNATDAYVVDIRTGYSVDHYAAEAGIFGSKGDGSASNA